MFNFFVKNLYLCGAIFIIVHVSFPFGQWISVSYSHYPISVVSPQTYFGVCSSRIQMNETNKRHKQFKYRQGHGFLLNARNDRFWNSDRSTYIPPCHHHHKPGTVLRKLTFHSKNKTNWIKQPDVLDSTGQSQGEGQGGLEPPRNFQSIIVRLCTVVLLCNLELRKWTKSYFCSAKNNRQL